ncbi:MAG: DUF4139 domain-containing protein [Flavobacteriales bacterium]
MHNLLLSFSALLIATSGVAQKDHRIAFDPGVSSITIYLNGGEVRTGKEVELVAGRNTILVQGLSPHTFVPSVQATIKGALEILSVNTASNFLDPGALEPRITRLQDSLVLLREKHADVQDRIAASNTEKEMLVRNHDIGGSGVIVSAEALAKAADFFRERTLHVNRTISKLEKEHAELGERIARAERQLAELNYRHDPNRMDVTIMVLSERAQKATVDLRYLVGNTGWAPIYDLVAKDITAPVTLRYKAQVYNNTGIDWSNVKLTLSTADPSLGASKPQLSRWELGRDAISGYDKQLKEFKGKKNVFSEDEYDGDEDYSGQRRPRLIQADTTQSYSMVAVAEVTAEFPIARPYDVPSDAKPYLVDIAEYTVPATYGYVAVPKLDRDAFLLARVTGWEKLNLVDGKANVYYGDAYVGASHISTASTDDTLDLSLGRDNNVQMMRKMVEDKTSKKLIGSERKETMTFEITVKNNGVAPITLNIQDQVPVSQDTEIKVDVLETSGARVEEKEGLVEWLAQLQPGESHNYTLSFAIRYPKNRQVQVQKLRTVACPSF